MAIIEKLKKKLGDSQTKERAMDKASPGPTKETGDPKITEEEKSAFAAIVRKPRITEKTTTQVQDRMYVFDVHPNASKHEVKQLVEKMYGVTVLGVRTIAVHRKKRMRGKLEGWKKGYKKAIVKVKEGQTIDLSV